jgi:hypothetical protein
MRRQENSRQTVLRGEDRLRGCIIASPSLVLLPGFTFSWISQHGSNLDKARAASLSHFINPSADRPVFEGSIVVRQEFTQ